jgi:hypothetical protein
MSRSAALGCLLALALVGCRNDDAYLGGGHQAYQCGTRCAVEQGAPENAGDWFFNPETELGDAPEIVYPLSGAVHPSDLRQLTVQFRRGRDDFEVFRIRIEAIGSGLSYDFFTRCLAVHQGCRYLLEGSLWDNARADLAGIPALLTVTGSTAAHGVLKISRPVPLNVVTSELGNKGFYYWTTVPLYQAGPNASQTGIFRLPFGADQAEPFIMPNSPTNERQCGACHSVSRDGSTIAFTARDYLEGPDDQRSGVLVAKLTATPDLPIIPPAAAGTYDSSMMALSYTGKRVLVAYNQLLELRSSAVDPSSKVLPGAVLASLSKDDLGGKSGYFPEFSPGDDAVALTLSDKPDSAIAVQAGDIAVIDIDLATSTFGKPRIIVPGTDDTFHFYPTWSPDGQYIAFASAPRLDEDGHPRKSYDQKMARLRLVKVDSGQVYELKNATHEVGKWSTYPKFAPFRAGEQGTLMFLTFNSKINYGLVVDNDEKTSDSARLAQLWMSAVDLAKLPEDPSSAPIWLPFQDATQPGHLGLWTNDVKCRTDLGGTGCAFGQRCDPETKTCIVKPK